MKLCCSVSESHLVSLPVITNSFLRLIQTGTLEFVSGWNDSLKKTY